MSIENAQKFGGCIELACPGHEYCWAKYLLQKKGFPALIATHSMLNPVLRELHTYMRWCVDPDSLQPIVDELLDCRPKQPGDHDSYPIPLYNEFSEHWYNF